MVDGFLHDVRYAGRSLRRAPGFACIAVLTLAVTLGANAAVFSVIDTVLLRPLPYRDADRLVVIHDVVPRLGRFPTSGREFQEWRRSARSFEAMALVSSSPMILTGAGEPERLETGRVSSALFPLLGVSAALGRTFTADEETAGRNRVVVLSDALWRTRFGGDTAIVGGRVTLNDEPYTVVGVLPATFRFPRVERLYTMPITGGSPELWVPFVIPPPDQDENSFACIARLRNGISVEQARTELTGIEAAIGRRITPPIPLAAEIVSLQEQITTTSKDNLLFVWAGVVLVLLIACTNLANLFLARAWDRRREIGLRAAIGARHGRLIQAMLIESAVVTAVGGGVGIAFAYVALPLIARTIPVDVPRLEEVAVNPRALVFTSVLIIVCSILLGAVPAIRVASTNMIDAIRGAASVAGQDRRDRGAKRLLVGTQVALTLVCLSAAGLLIRSFVNVLSVDRGFSAEHVLSLRVSLPPTRYPTREAKAAFVRVALEGLDALPAVTAAAVVNRLPLNGVAMNTLVAAAGTEDAPIPPQQRPLGDLRSVNPDYFRTLGIRLLSGRVFQDTDQSRSVAVVSRGMASRLWPSENPIGKQFRLAVDRNTLFTVIGTVEDVRAMGLDVQPPLSVYVPYWQGFLNDVSFALRTTTDELALAVPARNVIRGLDPQVPLDAIRPMSEVVASAVAPRRFEAMVLVLFGLVAVLLAGIGVYAVLSHTVLQRTRELGVRLALGANPSRMRRMVFGDALRLVIPGLVVGVPGAIAAGFSLRALLFGVQPQSPLVLVTAAGALLLIALAAAHIPARRASAVDPIISLRSQ